MYRIGVSSFGFELNERAFSKLRESNISAIEISMPAENFQNINYKEVEALSRKYEIDLWSYHLPLQFAPLPEIDPSSLDRDIRKNTVEYLSELVKKGSDIGIDKFVIHASGEPIREKREEKIKYTLEVLDTLAERAYQNGAYIAVENLPRTCLGNTAEEVSLLVSANDKLKVCFDTNHLLQEDSISFMDKLADKIITVHISDYDFINERHWLPGEGKNDWNGILSKFQEIGYNGVWMYEIALKCPKTIIRDRDLTFDDFYENAKSIFAGITPAIFSTHKENLGMWE